MEKQIQNIVRIDWYEVDQSTHVFVSGYAINALESTFDTANKIAKSIGQKSIKFEQYFKNSIPKIEYLEVY